VAVAIIIGVTDRWALVVCLFVLSTLTLAFIGANYGLGVVFITPLVLVLLSIARPGQWHLADIRIVNTLIGVVLGLAASTLVLNGSERAMVGRRVVDALAAVADYLGAIAGGTAPERTARRRAATAAVGSARDGVERVLREPLPGSHLEPAWGALAELSAEALAAAMDLGVRWPVGTFPAPLGTEVRVAAGRLRRAVGRPLPSLPDAATDLERPDVPHLPGGPQPPEGPDPGPAARAAITRVEEVVGRIEVAADEAGLGDGGTVAAAREDAPGIMGS
jgi:hypothetical protein